MKKGGGDIPDFLKEKLEKGDFESFSDLLEPGTDKTELVKNLQSMYAEITSLMLEAEKGEVERDLPRFEFDFDPEKDVPSISSVLRDQVNIEESIKKLQDGSDVFEEAERAKREKIPNYFKEADVLKTFPHKRKGEYFPEDHRPFGPETPEVIDALHAPEKEGDREKAAEFIDAEGQPRFRPEYLEDEYGNLPPQYSTEDFNTLEELQKKLDKVQFEEPHIREMDRTHKLKRVQDMISDHWHNTGLRVDDIPEFDGVEDDRERQSEDPVFDKKEPKGKKSEEKSMKEKRLQKLAWKRDRDYINSILDPNAPTKDMSLQERHKMERFMGPNSGYLPAELLPGYDKLVEAAQEFPVHPRDPSPNLNAKYRKAHCPFCKVVTEVMLRAKEDIRASNTSRKIFAGFRSRPALSRTLAADDILFDHMNTPMLLRYMNEFGSILPRLKTGVCTKHQRKLSKAIKRARAFGFFTYKDSFFEIRSPYYSFTHQDWLRRLPKVFHEDYKPKWTRGRPV